MGTPMMNIIDDSAEVSFAILPDLVGHKVADGRRSVSEVCMKARYLLFIVSTRQSRLFSSKSYEHSHNPSTCISKAVLLTCRIKGNERSSVKSGRMSTCNPDSFASFCSSTNLLTSSFQQIPIVETLDSVDDHME